MNWSLVHLSQSQSLWDFHNNFLYRLLERIWVTSVQFTIEMIACARTNISYRWLCCKLVLLRLEFKPYRVATSTLESNPGTLALATSALTTEQQQPTTSKTSIFYLCWVKPLAAVSYSTDHQLCVFSLVAKARFPGNNLEKFQSSIYEGSEFDNSYQIIFKFNLCSI